MNIIMSRSRPLPAGLQAVSLTLQLAIPFLHQAALSASLAGDNQVNQVHVEVQHVNMGLAGGEYSRNQLHWERLQGSWC